MRWQRLVLLIYVAACVGVLHFLWLVKADVRLPTAFGLVLVALLSFRLVRRRALVGRSIDAAVGGRRPPQRVADMTQALRRKPESAKAP